MAQELNFVAQVEAELAASDPETDEKNPYAILAHARQDARARSWDALRALVADQTTAALELERSVQRERRLGQRAAFRNAVRLEQWADAELYARGVAEVERRETAIRDELKKRGAK